jgi:hypothetical protein
MNQGVKSMHSIDGKKPVGVLFRQIKEAHKQNLIREYKFHESQLIGHNQSNTIALTLCFLDKTNSTTQDRVIQHIKNNFRVLTISRPVRSPMIATIVLNLIAGEE